MEYTMFLTQIIGCIVAALVVAVLWCHWRLNHVERDMWCILNNIEDVCSITEHNHGAWIECSKCGEWFPWQANEEDTLNYCPKCGAKVVK